MAAQLVKNPPATRETWVRSLGGEDSPGEGKGYYPLQDSGLENSMDHIVHGVAKSRTRLSDLHFHFLPSSPTVCRSLKPYYCLQLLSAFFSSFSCLLDHSWCFIDNFSSFFLWELPCMLILIKPGVNDYLHFLGV